MVYKEFLGKENRSITRIQDRLQEKSLTTQVQLEDIYCSSTNGTLLWRITNVGEKIGIYTPLWKTTTCTFTI